ncbi:RecA domain protein [Parafrankia sp. EAN1pec]|nr:RecA domain protein [Frankia sp. EAN1pec]
MAWSLSSGSAKDCSARAARRKIRHQPSCRFSQPVRHDVRRIETLKDGQEAVANRTRVKVVRNKMAPPFRMAEFDIVYGGGISREGSLIDMGVEHTIIRKSGAWYTDDGDQLGQGKENARSFLRDNPDLANETEKRIKEKLGLSPTLDADAPPPVAVDFWPGRDVPLRAGGRDPQPQPPASGMEKAGGLGGSASRRPCVPTQIPRVGMCCRTAYDPPHRPRRIRPLHYCGSRSGGRPHIQGAGLRRTAAAVLRSTGLAARAMDGRDGPVTSRSPR